MSKSPSPKPPTAPNAPANSQKNSSQQSQSSIVAAQWEGPLPPPGALEQFDRIIPNGAERIMVMCEQEQNARISNERLYARAEVAIEIGGRALGGLLVLICIAAAIWSIHIGANWKVTLGFLSVTVMGAIAKLFDGARTQRKR